MDSTCCIYPSPQAGVGRLLKKPTAIISANSKLINGLLDRFNPSKKVATRKVVARKSVARQLTVAA